ncbi:MAG: beta-hydroxyacyl-ACP dehydratase [Desulfobacteraceae bacterium]|nr:beta-hydroxyacyl-ACP dehydratase [Desulfobacteraceae bacterium]
MRFILIDRITEFEPGYQAQAIKNITLSEDFFDDHFPLKPVMPGVLILEGLAEIAGLLLEETVRKQQGVNVKALLSLIEKAKFRDFVTPGDQLVYQVSVESVNEMGGKMKGKILRDNTKIGDAKLVFTLHEIDNPRLDRRREELLRFWLDTEGV